MDQNNNQNSNVQNNSIPNNNINVVDTTSTNLPEPSVIEIPTPSNSTPVVKEEVKKDGTFKYILTFIFLIGIVLFVIFLPEVSELLEGFMGKSAPKGNTTLLNNGTLYCSKVNSGETTDVKYNYDLLFENKSLISSSFTIRYESIDLEYLNKRKLECDKIAIVSQNIKGINTTCSLASGILTITENYEYKNIDTSNLTQYTEVGGTYPEFEYNKNIYDIKSTLKKQGYDCEEKAN